MKRTSPLSMTIASAALLALAGCAGPAQTTLADGSVAYRIDCSASPSGMNFCFENAGKSCGADGYQIVGRDGEILGDSTAAASENTTVVKAWQTNSNSIYIRCGS